jgi:predicted glycosyltransferase
MNIFVNISHPAHVHFFKNAMKILSQRGHNVITGARYKEFTIDLLNAYKVKHTVLTKKGQGLIGLIKELIKQQFKISKIIRENQLDLMLQISGIFNAPVGRYYGVPTLAFSDTENDKWGNKLSFSLSRHVIMPTCFDHAIGGSWKNQIHYPGYHELAYLAPRYLTKKIEPKNKFLVRFVGWQAGHDIGEKGLSIDQKIEIVNILKNFGSVHITSEAPLPDEIAEFACKIHPSEIHDFMVSCKMIVGESATMASEAACMGIPAIFISNTGRGYTTEQDKKYGLIKHYQLRQWNEIVRTMKEWASQDLRNEWQKRRRNMLKDKIDVTAWMVDLVENYPNSITKAKSGSFSSYALR